MNPVIFHADMNAYFASVEELFHPELKEVPMAICGDPAARRGIILAKNQKAKKYGVQTAETIYQAMQKCPGLVLRPARRGAYSEYCERANAIYGDYTDLVERASIDESYLDVTGTLHLFGCDGEALAHILRERIKKELGLTISVGVSYNKLFAKMGSDLKKPDAVTLITRQNYKQLLWPLPVGELLMVGKATRQALSQLNLLTIGDLAQADPALLTQKLGKLGEHLHRGANGLDTSPVLPAGAEVEAKSIGNGCTFARDLTTRQEVITALNALCDTVAARLRREGLKALTVQLTIKDAAFAVITRQKPLGSPTWLAAELSKAALKIWDASWQAGKPIRLLTVTAQKLVPKEEALVQTSLFDQPGEDASRQKREKLEMAMDDIRNRYGVRSIARAGSAYNDLGLREGHGAGEEE